jgi:hypothetical protein
LTSPGIAKVVVTFDGPKGSFVIDDLAVLDSQDVRATADAIFDPARARCNLGCNRDGKCPLPMFHALSSYLLGH